jgi:hypothetical protein
LDEFCIAYLNDILIYSKDPLKYIKQVYKVLSCFQEASLQVNIKKSEFDIIRTKYLGYILITTSLKIDPNKVKPL